MNLNRAEDLMLQPTSMPLNCPICGAPTAITDAKYPGYRDLTFFEIRACSGCGCSLALPLASDDSLYEAIYAQADIIPGYERYARFANGAARAADPLGYLASKEEAYWAVQQATMQLPPTARILDVGTGLGYVAYAVAQAGYDASGLDLSKEAVERARRRFGDHYVAADFFEWAQLHEGEYDLVVMLELIEHVEEPERWISAALRLIKPSGSVLLSTPNREFYTPGTVWETEAPPVHLWWFTRESLRCLAHAVHAIISFPSLSACGIVPRPMPDDDVRTQHSPMLTASGKARSTLRRLLKRLGLLNAVMGLYERRDLARRRAASGRPDVRETLVAELRKR